MKVVAWITIVLLVSIALRVTINLVYSIYSARQLGAADAALALFGLFAAWGSHVVFKTLIGSRVPH